MELVASRPPSPRQFARRYPLTTFVVLALVITWPVWVPRALASQGYLDSDWPTTLGRYWTYGPAAAAVLAAWMTFDRTGLRELGSRLRRWRVGWPWYAMVLLDPAALWVVVVAVNAALGWSEYLDRPLIVQHGPAAATLRRHPAGEARSGTIPSAEALGRGVGRSGGHR